MDFISSSSPDAKISLNINAFNGNTTNFSRCPAPKSLPIVQPNKPNTLFGTSRPTVVPM